MAASRNLLAENQSVKKAQGASTYILGWIAQLIAFAGGSYAENSWPGSALRFIFGLIPWDNFIPAVLIIWTIGWAIDIINDLTPNQIAITFGIVSPSLAAEQSGTIANRITEWSEALRQAVGGHVESLAGNLSFGTLAVICAVIAVIIGRRFLPKQASGAGGGGGR